MVATMYLPVILCFWLSLEQPYTKEGFWKNIGIHPKYLGFTLLALVLAMLSQLICFLFLFTAGFYGSFVAIDSWISKKSHPFKLNAYNVLFLFKCCSSCIDAYANGQQPYEAYHRIVFTRQYGQSHFA